MNKLLNLLGLCMRAGKVVSGEQGVEIAVKGKKAFLVIISSDASKNTMKKFKNSCEYYNVPYIVISDKYTLGSAIGKDNRAVIGITEEGFALKLKELSETCDN
ncbi:MAG: ribosomal L7Ae/L30e/S12e/Gadd45 family protein [Tyzzerella sp.]|uniref:Ribosomal L7Ae/L30e/S12e/Gadd45 family protein n=1 Tax=Candidatus Fimicola merdigallinarum TaxID=2840819 RepID=A0A9D9DY45_9FIRM|nr:ribosomal L7Ae/L30e/S12e/Gadd45 family protein [Candidatus Fimicola merdigallinarum]